MEEKYIIVNSYQTLQPYCPDLYSKCIIRIPSDMSEEISIYQYPTNGMVSLDDLISLFVDGRIDEHKDTPRKHKPDVSKEREHIRDYTFTAQGCKMKILLYDKNHGKYSTAENVRAKAVFMTRDERYYRMAAIKHKPDTLNFITNNIFENSIVGESEAIYGDALLVVEQCVNQYKLSYALTYNKPVQKPELYIERAIDRAREVLEASNDICSDLALNEFLMRKGLNLSTVWIFSVLVKSKLIKQICQSIILSNVIKRIVDKEIFVSSNIDGKDKLPGGVFRNDKNVVAPGFQKSIIYILESIITRSFEKEPKLFKNIMMTLFFYRLESLPFHNTLQFEVGTKDYLQGKFILDDIIHVPSENPAVFLKTLQNI